MRAIVATAIASVLGWNATASAQSYSTNCMAMGSMIHCDSRDQSHDWDGLAVGIQRLHDRHVQKKIAKMINGGDCRGAYSYALEEGFDWARQVQEACASR